jgi:hypothetical protein
MKKYFATFVFRPAFVFLFFTNAFAQIDSIAITRQYVSEIVERSFPELKNKKIEIKTFSSESDYFQSRFKFCRFLTFRELRYVVFVNPKVYERNAPENGIRAILAHEISHIAYYASKNRLQLLGLVALVGDNFTRKFERRTDLEAISRGYGLGLIAYRNWLYENIPAKNLKAKKRNYLTPEEIEIELKKLKKFMTKEKIYD